jgi:uncharacterized protein with HEPN domain
VRSDLERLQDILDAIMQIEKYTGTGRDAFDRDEMVRVWVVHHLQIIGEAARSIADDLRQRHPHVPWSQIIGMRHILVHQYFGLKWDEVWDTVQRDLPNLKRDIEGMQRDLTTEEDTV